MDDRELEILALKYGLSADLLREYHGIFRGNGIPVSLSGKTSERAERIVMVSTHGYWGDPPPAALIMWVEKENFVSFLHYIFNLFSAYARN